MVSDGIKMNFVYMNYSNVVELLLVPFLWIQNMNQRAGRNTNTSDQPDQQERHRKSTISHSLESSLLPGL